MEFNGGLPWALVSGVSWAGAVRRTVHYVQCGSEGL